MSPKVLLAACLFALALAGCADKSRELSPSVAGPKTPPKKSYKSGVFGPLVERLAKDGFNERDMDELFAKTRFSPTPMTTKLRELLRYGMSTERGRRIQLGLFELGYEIGGVDGVIGESSRAAIVAFQEDRGLPPDGDPTDALLEKIREVIKTEGKKRSLDPTPGAAPPKRPVKQVALSPNFVAAAKTFYDENRTLLASVEAKTGVPGDVIVGILKVETDLGRFLGSDNALVIVASMALAADFSVVENQFQGDELDKERRDFLAQKSKERGDRAYRDLKALLAYAAQSGQDPSTIPGSCYGAIGYCQFMPRNIAKFAVDGDNDGKIDLFSFPDAAHSIGKYLAEHAKPWGPQSRAGMIEAVYGYNHSTAYVAKVLSTADAISGRWFDKPAPKAAAKGKGKAAKSEKAKPAGKSRSGGR